jgi:hypothetical protein
MKSFQKSDFEKKEQQMRRRRRRRVFHTRVNPFLMNQNAS